MGGIISAVYSFIYYGSIDFAIFTAVDCVVVKPFQNKIRTELDKSKLWFYEFLVLLVLCGITYMLSHTPYILVVFCLITLRFSLVRQAINIQQWWTDMKTRWDDCQQHEESMENLRQQNKDSPGGVSGQPHPGLLPMITLPHPAMSFQQPQLVMPGGQVSAGTPTTAQNPFQNYASPTDRYSFNTTQNCEAYMSNLPRDKCQPRVSTPAKKTVPSTQTNQKHGKASITPKKIRHFSAGTKNNNALGPLKSVWNMLSFKSVAKAQDTPPGLQNNGQNICFINASLQCLTRCPMLVKRLNDLNLMNLRCTTDEVNLTKVLSDLLNTLHERKDGKAVSLDVFRESASVFKPNLVGAPGLGPQNQQDAAEFITWLLETLHSILLTERTNPDGRQVDSYTSAALNTLKFVYGDLSPTRIEMLKNACRREIDIAHGLDTKSYAEPIQRLSDLEWLTYKQNSQTLIDDLFTGQCMDAHHCLECNRISINIQTFNVLPMPIVEPQDKNGIVYLENCFEKFGHIETLFGREGLSCSNCKLNQLIGSNMGSTGYFQTPGGAVLTVPPGVKQRLLHSTPATFAGKEFNQTAHLPSMSSLREELGDICMSPIPSDITIDSGFHDNHHRTSTPVAMTSPTPLKSINTTLSNAQRRSMLRHFPDILIIQLMRYDCDGAFSRKVTTPVSIPIENLDLTNIVFDTLANREDITASENSYKYDLCGFCLHIGASITSSGHYISYSSDAGGNWYKFDDEIVKRVDIYHELTLAGVSNNLYVLFYKRRQNDITESAIA